VRLGYYYLDNLASEIARKHLLENVSFRELAQNVLRGALDHPPPP